MTSELELEIVLPSGITIDADLWQPSINRDVYKGNKLAVCLHPWSWLGGQKRDPVLSSLIDPLLSENYHVLLYNSRGVGKSSGWASFTGFNEAEDLKAVVKWALDKVTDVRSLVLLGYSYGSLIASLHPVISRVKTSHVLLSYPLGPRTWLTLFNSGTYNSALKDLAQDPNSNILLIYGDQDEFTSCEKYKNWISELQESNVEIVEVDHGSHFWRGRSEQKLIQVIQRWLAVQVFPN